MTECKDLSDQYNLFLKPTKGNLEIDKHSISLWFYFRH